MYDSSKKGSQLTLVFPKLAGSYTYKGGLVHGNTEMFTKWFTKIFNLLMYDITPFMSTA